MKKKKILGLIPVRLNSSRLNQKSLLLIKKIPLIIHTYRRAKLSRKLDDVIICCDDKKILKVAKKFNAKAIITSKKHKNGTERIYEAYKKIKKNYDYVIDIQGDEPLINPQQIDNVIKFHLKNKDSDIILPSMSLKNISNSIFEFFESRFPVGSSAKIIFGLLIIALAIATLCFSPPESILGFLSFNLSNPK